MKKNYLRTWGSFFLIGIVFLFLTSCRNEEVKDFGVTDFTDLTPVIRLVEPDPLVAKYKGFDFQTFNNEKFPAGEIVEIEMVSLPNNRPEGIIFQDKSKDDSAFEVIPLELAEFIMPEGTASVGVNFGPIDYKLRLADLNFGKIEVTIDDLSPRNLGKMEALPNSQIKVIVVPDKDYTVCKHSCYINDTYVWENSETYTVENNKNVFKYEAKETGRLKFLVQEDGVTPPNKIAKQPEYELVTPVDQPIKHCQVISFEMPANDITIGATFAEINDPDTVGYDAREAEYAVAPAACQNGRIVVQPARGKPGTEVDVFFADLKPGYGLKAGTLLCNGENIETSKFQKEIAVKKETKEGVVNTITAYRFNIGVGHSKIRAQFTDVRKIGSSYNPLNFVSGTYEVPITISAAKDKEAKKVQEASADYIDVEIKNGDAIITFHFKEIYDDGIFMFKVCGKYREVKGNQHYSFKVPTSKLRQTLEFKTTKGLGSKGWIVKPMLDDAKLFAK